MSDPVPQVSYTRRKTLGNYEFEELTLTFPAANGSVEEVEATMEFVMASVNDKLKLTSEKDEQVVASTSVF